MPSQAMQDAIDALRERRKASAGQAPPTLEERRAAFVPGDRLHPVPDDVRVTEVTAGGVPAHWLTAAGADAGRVLLFLPLTGHSRPDPGILCLRPGGPGRRQLSGIGSASAARQGAAWKGSAKYWVSCVTRSPPNSMTLTE
jgi:hypothetical protein